MFRNVESTLKEREDEEKIAFNKSKSGNFSSLTHWKMHDSLLRDINMFYGNLRELTA